MFFFIPIYNKMSSTRKWGVPKTGMSIFRFHDPPFLSSRINDRPSQVKKSLMLRGPPLIKYKTIQDPLDQELVGWFVSQKLNGIFCRWDGNRRRLLTKSGHDLDLPNWFIEDFPSGVMLDGELFSATKHPTKWFSRLRRHGYSEEDTPADLQFCVFDWVERRISFEDRLNKLTTIIESKSKNKSNSGVKRIKLVPYSKIRNRSQIEKWVQRCENQSWEGLIFRDPSGLYRNDQKLTRTSQVLKWKPWISVQAKWIKPSEDHPDVVWWIKAPPYLPKPRRLTIRGKGLHPVAGQQVKILISGWDPYTKQVDLVKPA